MTPRRRFLRRTALTGAGFLGLHRLLASGRAEPSFDSPWGPLQEDPHRILDLPPGFRYRVLSRTGDRMSDGYRVPGQPDGMGAFASPDGRHTIVVRNHEIGHMFFQRGPFQDNRRLPPGFDPALSYDPGRLGAGPFVGGTTTIVYDHRNERVVRQFLSLTGTDRNCAGGQTPWNSWITCEEPQDLLSPWGVHHGYCFEVPATMRPGLVKPVPLRAMGRFRHEAVAVHPGSGIVYLSEDRGDGLLYRFVPKTPGKLSAGGELQAMRLRGEPSLDTRNWPELPQRFPTGRRFAVDWVPLEDVESPDDSLRHQGFARGAVRFSRAEGMWYGEAAGPDQPASVYWCCTDGGEARMGQIFRYLPSMEEGRPGEKDAPGEMELFIEPNDSALLENGDNLTVAPWGDLIVCEDGPASNAIRGITPRGECYTLALNGMNGFEMAGACFGPDGTLFVNIQYPGTTLAVKGPWQWSRPVG